jgi:hypothetical protein
MHEWAETMTGDDDKKPRDRWSKCDDDRKSERRRLHEKS